MGSYVSPDGRRIVKTGSGRTKSEAKAKLKEVLRDYEDGPAIAPSDYTVKDTHRGEVDLRRACLGIAENWPC